MTDLPKHLRPRWRYLAVMIETWPEAEIDRGAFQQAARDAARSLFGEVGSAAIDLRLFRFDHGEGSGEAVVRTHREEVTRARAAVACVDAVSGHPVGIWVRGVSGTVKSCEEKYLGERREPVGERNVVFGNAVRTAVARNCRLDVRTGGAFTGATELDFE